jgi:hypothetical protein
MMGKNDENAKGKLNNRMGRVGRPINANVDWSKYLKTYEKVSKEQLINNISGSLLQTKTAVSGEVIKQYTDVGSRDGFIKSATIQIMSEPEYQLC